MFTSTRDRKNRPVTKLKGKSLTEQAHTKGTDINYLVKRFTEAGREIPSIDPEDFKESDAITFHEAMNLVTRANTSFNNLPSDIRNSYNNDPGLFMAAIKSADKQAEIAEQHNVQIGSKEETVNPVDDASTTTSVVPDTTA